MPADPFRHLGADAEEEAPLLPVGRSLILAIGIDRYAHHPELTNAVSDAKAVLELFRRCGFEEPEGVPSLFNEQATLKALTSLVRDDDQLPGKLQPDDSLVLFFAGHGATVSRDVPDPEHAGKTISHRTGYLIPVDAREQKPGDWARLDSLLDDVSALPARHVLVILDACKSGFALSEKFKFRGEGQGGGTLAELAGRVSRRVMTSAMHDQKAMDGGGSGNSLFTETLVDAVENLRADRDGDGYITTTDLFAFVRQQVSDTADRVHHVRQTPDYGQLPGDGSGELVLSLRGDTYNRLRAAETLEVAEHIYQLGWLSGDSKRFESAARYFKAAHELASLGKMPLPEARLGLGRAFLAAGRAGEAANVLAELVRSEGDAAPTEAQFYLGLACAKRGEYAPAAEALRVWQSQHPESPDAAWIGAYVDWLSQSASPAAGRKLALLVGIDHYRLPRARPLDGCANDVQKLMKRVLMAHGGFQEPDVTVLTDSQATRARFLQELRRLVKDATLSDAVVVHFSGHAVPASHPDIFGKNDNNIYLLLHDTNDDPGYLTDGITAGDLHRLMQEIPAGRKTLILDTHASEEFMELARREGTYALVLASDTAEIAYEWHVDVAGEDVRCGMLTGALYQSLLEIGDQTLTYGDWITSAIRIAQQASSNTDLYPQRQTPYFSGIRGQRVFGPDDIFLSVFEFSQRHEWPELPLEELTRLYAIFCHAITAPHPQGHAAFGRAFLTKDAFDQAIGALQTAVMQAGDTVPSNLLTLVQSQFRAGYFAEASATLQQYAPLAVPADGAQLQELAGLLGKLATSRKHALLIGIDRYQSREVHPLQGASNDVAAIKQLLTQHWGFLAEDTVELVDAEATRASIIAQFEHLVDVARREPALFFFAGRGSHDQDRLPTLIPCDGRQARVSDIALQELAGLVGKDATNLVVVLDADFSGHAREETHRTIEADDRTEKVPPRFATDEDRMAYLNTLWPGAVTIYQNVRAL